MRTDASGRRLCVAIEALRKLAADGNVEATALLEEYGLDDITGLPKEPST